MNWIATNRQQVLPTCPSTGGPSFVEPPARGPRSNLGELPDVKVLWQRFGLLGSISGNFLISWEYDFLYDLVSFHIPLHLPGHTVPLAGQERFLVHKAVPLQVKYRVKFLKHFIAWHRSYLVLGGSEWDAWLPPVTHRSNFLLAENNSLNFSPLKLPTSMDAVLV